MKRIGLSLSLLLLLVLAACAGGGTGQLPASRPAEDVESPVEAVEDEPEAPAAVAGDDAAAVAASDPTLVRDRDWTKGTTEPLITVVEYGDFQ